MKNYSFSNTEESYPTRKSTELSNCYRHSELKAKEANQRIQEIKRKYETPNRRERIDSLQKSQLGQQPRTPYLDSGKQNSMQLKDSSIQALDKYVHQPAPTFGTNPLKESFAVNRLEKSMLRNDVDCKHIENLRRSNENKSPYEDRGKHMHEFKSHTREDQEALFSKVREMKESLINQDLMRRSINDRSSTSSYKYSHEPRNETRNYDPRVENIDKINSKIKQILNCLAENEKHPSKYIRDSPQSKYSQDESRKSTLSSQVFARQSFEDHSKSVYIHNEEDRHNKFTAPLTTVPAEKKIEESNIYNFYKNNETKQEQPVMKSTYQECKTTPNEQTPVLKYKDGDGDQSRLRDRDYSVGRCQGYASKLLRQRQEINSRTPSCAQGKYDYKSAIRGSRSRSHMGVSKSAITDTDKDVLRSGKKLTEEISKIQNRIQNLESQKKKLNISFTPFSHTKSSRSSSLLAPYQVTSSTDHKFSAEEKSHIPHFRSSSTTKERHLTAHFGNSKDSDHDLSRPVSLGKDITKSVEWQQSRAVPELNTRPNFQMSLENVDVDVKTVRIDKPDVEAEENTFNKGSQEYEMPAMGREISFAYDEVKRRTDNGIQERKRKLQHTEIIKTDGLKKLVGLFCEQAKFDEHLRNLKIWFECIPSHSKFLELASALKGFGCNFSEQQCKRLFTVEESEHNPFFSVQGFEGTIKELAKAYSEADGHWASSIKNKFDRDNLQAEGFTKNKIDLERKGFIELEDLVRLLNIESGTFYRNRDIFLIFRRLTSSDRTSFEQVLAQISA